MDRWFVICLDKELFDGGKYVFATTRHFTSLEQAQDYKSTIHHKRDAIVVEASKDIPNIARYA